ncbi:hypothetical protein L7F22_022521 [Adiantum nelumboides]|nr:hypothetical protein [Adiantum nelumboides]
MTDFSDLVAGYHRFRDTDYKRQHGSLGPTRRGPEPACDGDRLRRQPHRSRHRVRRVARRDHSSSATSPRSSRLARLAAVATAVSAAIEYAVTQLEVPEIVVMGHGSCGGVQASLTGVFDGAAPGEGGFGRALGRHASGRRAPRSSPNAAPDRTRPARSNSKPSASRSPICAPSRSSPSARRRPSSRCAAPISRSATACCG